MRSSLSAPGDHAREQGYVVIMFTVTTGSDTVDPKVVQSASPALDEAALGVVRDLRCATARRAVRIMAPLRFRL